MSSVVKWLKKNIPLIVVSCLCLGFLIATIVLAVALTDSNDKLEELNHQPVILSPWQEDYRIPSAIKPEIYEIELVPDIVAGTFTGSVTVTMKILAAVKYIPIHIKNLFITDTKLTVKPGNTNVPLREIIYDFPNQFYVLLPLAEYFEAGDYSYQLNFRGSLTNSIVGFYLIQYKDEEASKKMVSSKFEPTDARAAFPCFDEPALKAMFKISIIAPHTHTTTLSNMNLVRTEPYGTSTRYIFEQSVKMSTYLAVFIVSQFTSQTETITVSGKSIKVTVYARNDAIHAAEQAMNVMKEVTPYYAEYFGVAYPLPKLDLIAIPNFVSGAMENWGLITFRESSMLFDPDLNSVSNQRSISSTVAHEIAHMWFGNLVTMKWWDDLWLNEGFASFMSTKSLDEKFPIWNNDAQFVVDSLHSVMEKDALTSSHPIIQHAENPDQITSLFDSISYDKGEAVLRMLEDWLTEEKFQAGITKYLTAHSFSNAESDDLWASLGSGVKSKMDGWTKKMGYPIVTAVRNKNQIKLTQKRFMTDLTFQESSKSTWDIPIKWFSSKSSTPATVTWFSSSKSEITIEVDESATWYKLNPNQKGFYRVNYDDDNWNALKDNMLSITDPRDRANLIDDAFSLSNAELKDYSFALSFSTYLVNETHYIPWTTGASKLGNMRDRLLGTSVHLQIQDYIRDLVKKQFPGWNTTEDTRTDYPKKRLQAILGEAILAAEDTSNLATVSETFLDWLNNNTQVDVDLRQTIYYYGMQQGTKTEWDRLWTKYIAETNAQEKTKLQRALAAIDDQTLLQTYLGRAHDPNQVRQQDYFNVLGYIAANPKGTDLVWNYYRNNFDKLVQKFTLNSRPLGNFILSVTSSFSTQQRLDEMNQFYTKYPDAGAGTGPRQQALENVQNNINWLDANEHEISNWLDAHITRSKS